MIFAGILDVLEFAQWQVGVYKVRIASHELAPFEVTGHGNWAIPQSFNRVVLLISFALENAGKSIVGLLDFANNNRLELATRVFNVKVGLSRSVWYGFCASAATHPV